MPTAIACNEWDDSAWDDEGNALNLVQVGGTFNVSMIDFNNRVLWLQPQNLKATQWANATFWNSGTLPFTLNQTFTVTSVDLNNRIAYLSG